MLCLLFSVGERRLSITARDVERVLELPTLQPAHGAPAYVQGLFQYKNKWVPVIDLCKLVLGQPCAEAMNTRLVIVRIEVAEHPTRMLGVIAETVDETRSIHEDDFKRSGLNLVEESFFGDIAIADGDLIHHVKPEQLLSEEAHKLISPETLT
ncbi:chemotaxis protein CheW [Thiolapillus brandeum]|uniref:Purine-binding chemotaxis protein CheW n=1 Tax=Thiolapillus brandeum TaxID=1076588 RepID=A0A7U6GIS7_9GAMM|nr:chemotaxis protein CheW [Thiolapillus brandeum]BAO44399.1 purine-binding chemotaxis protein CheW [Thiolapillus brandeum]